MEYFDIDMNAYNLHIIKTNKFKTITVDVCFRRKIKKEEITIRNLLKEMMIDSNSVYPDENSLVIETENLYDLKLLASNFRVGNYTIMSFRSRFLNEKYTEKGMNIESINFLMDIIFKPLFGDNLNKCKSRIKKSITSLRDNKIKYALYRLLENTKNMSYSYNDYGYINDLKKIDNGMLKDYYDSMIKNDLIDIFVVGDVSPDEIKNVFREHFMISTFHKNDISIIVPELVKKREVITDSVKDNVNQTQLTMLCSLHGLTDFERKYVLPVYGELLGGTSGSILFDTVREKNSYAYYINAMVKPYDNIMLIYAGIDMDNEKEVSKLINKSLKDISHGKFDLEKLENAKKTYIAAITASMDSPVGLINNAYGRVLANAKDIPSKIKEIKKVNRNDIINVSKKIEIYSKFILEASYEKD